MVEDAEKAIAFHNFLKVSQGHLEGILAVLVQDFSRPLPDLSQWQNLPIML